MKLHLTTSATQKMFTASGAGYVSVNSQRYTHPVVVMPDQVLTDWQPAFETLNESHFDALLALQPEVLLLGTGDTLRFPAPALYRKLIAARIGVECMDTPAACRTYNILMAEGRKVVAAVLVSSR